MIDLQTELEQVPESALELIRRAVTLALENGGVRGDGRGKNMGAGVRIHYASRKFTPRGFVAPLKSAARRGRWKASKSLEPWPLRVRIK